nr:hypothetical protein [uncultured Sphaerochaeta sp.]
MGNKIMEATVVTQIDKHTVVINKGADDGVTEDDVFLIYSLGDELKDPKSGIELGKLEIVHGKGIVAHLQPRMTTIISCVFDEQPTKKIIRKPSSFYNPYFAGDSSITEETFDPPVRKAFTDLKLDTKPYFARRVG